MGSRRTPYADAASTPEMVADCHEVGRELRFPSPYDRSQATDDRRDSRRRDDGSPVTVTVSDALSELADGLEVSLSR